MDVQSTHTTADAGHKGEEVPGEEVARGQGHVLDQGHGQGDLVLGQAAEVVPGPGVGTADPGLGPRPSPGAKAVAGAEAEARVQKRSTTAAKAEVNRHQDSGLRPRAKAGAEVGPQTKQKITIRAVTGDLQNEEHFIVKTLRGYILHVTSLLFGKFLFFSSPFF